MILDVMHIHLSHCQMVNSVKNGIIFGVDNSSLVFADNRKENIFVKP